MEEKSEARGEWPLRIKNRYVRGHYLTLDEEGILDPRLKVGPIRWLDIKRAYCRRFNFVDYICLEVYQAESYLSRRSILLRLVWRLTRWSGLKRFSIVTNGLKTDPAWLFDFIISEVERRRANAIESGKEGKT